MGCLSIPADNRSPGFFNIVIMARSIALAFNPQQRIIEWYQLSADTGYNVCLQIVREASLVLQHHGQHSTGIGNSQQKGTGRVE